MPMIHGRGRSTLDTNANLLVALEALLTTRSVTRAAAKMGLTQSTMSGTLAQLRELFGDPLLVRNGRAMAPTPRALELLGPLREGVAAFDRVLAGPPAFDPATSTEAFVLALPDRVELALFGELLATVRALAPRVELQVLPWGRLDPPPGLATGEIDVSIGVLGPPPTEPDPRWRGVPNRIGPGHHTEPLFDSGLICMVRGDHPRVGRRLTLATFCELEHVLVTEELGARGIVDDALADVGRSRRIAVRVPRHILVGELIAGSDLIATIDRRVARLHAERWGLRLFKPPVALPRGRFGMIWHARTDSDPARTWLRRRIAEVAGGRRRAESVCA